MPLTAAPSFAFDTSYVRDLEGLFLPWRPNAVPQPRLLVLNEPLARELGLDPEALASPAGVDVLAGNVVPEGAASVAMAYAGHQFGSYSPRLGDGRALLLGEVLDVHGRRRDLHFKGSGRTPFARGGDGKAAVGPMLREHVIGEAMHALGIPTTRALAVVATGEDVVRETVLPGAVLTRVAASHLRVGTFEYAARLGEPDVLRRLADHAIARHHPEAAEADNPYLALLERVVEVQASLIAQWMLVGFIHGVMNTDNMTISGETIDFGPCAFMDAFDPATVFSSIDHAGRYAYGNQPTVAGWNLARLAETLLPLIDPDDPKAAVGPATAAVDAFAARCEAHWLEGLRTKLALPDDTPEATRLLSDFLGLLVAEHADLTTAFRALGPAARGDDAPLRALVLDRERADAWLERWRAALGTDRDPAALDRANPVYIPRNHLVEEALTAATAGDLDPYHRLVDAVSRPFDERPGLERYAEPAPDSFGAYVTYCGT